MEERREINQSISWRYLDAARSLVVLDAHSRDDSVQYGRFSNRIELAFRVKIDIPWITEKMVGMKNFEAVNTNKINMNIKRNVCVRIRNQYQYQ